MDTGSDFIGPVNLGNPSEISMIELADRVKRLTGSRSKIVHRELPQDDPTQRKPDITKARTHLDWEPRVPLEDGLNETVGYFRKLLRDGM